MLLVFAVAGCADEATHTAVPVTRQAPTSPDTLLFDSRVAVFLEASSAALDSMRTRLPEDDYYTAADDMMYYRSTAYDYLEQIGVTVRRLQGRPQLRFVVAGAPQVWAPPDAPTLDAIVLYEPGKQPQTIAPVDVEAATAFFGLTPPPR